LSGRKSDRIIPEGRPRLLYLSSDEADVVRQPACQAFVIDQSKAIFGCRVSPRAYFQTRSVNRAKTKLVWEFFTARLAFFHGNLLVRCGETSGGELA
jgi:hypothetical protein